MRKLIVAVLLGLAAVLPARAQTVTLKVCNTGSVDVDVFTQLEDGGRTGSSSIKPSACAAVATAGADGMEAYVGLAFVDARGQWGPPKRFQALPNMGVRPIPQGAGLAAALRGQVIPAQPRIVSAADKQATVRHAGVFAVLPMQLLFRPAFPTCRSVPTGNSDTTFIGGKQITTIEHEQICEDIAYTLTVEPHPDSHEASLESLPVGGAFTDAQLRSGALAKTVQIDWAQVAADKKQRDAPTSLGWNDLVPEFKKSLETVPDPNALTGVRYAYRMPSFIKVRGTVSAVEVRQQTVDERTKVTLAEINFRESPAAAGAARPEFNVCTTRLDVLQDVFGADFRASMIGKTIEVEGRPRGQCSGRLGKIEFFLARQVRSVGGVSPNTLISSSSAPEQTTQSAATPIASAPLAAGVQTVAAYQPSWIGQKMKVIGTVSRFVRRDVKGEKYLYLYFKERPDSTVVACSRDDNWLLGVLGVDNFESLVGTSIEFSGDIVKGTCTEQGAGLWIWERHQARIIGGPAR